MSKRHLCLSAVAALAISTGAMSAQAAVIGQLTTYQPQPTSDTDAEFIFTGAAFTHGPGSVGNGDGELAVPLQTAPGLQFNTDFTVPGIPGSTVNGDGSTDFYDCSLLLGGLAVSAPAVLIPLPGPITQVVQPLGAGSFEVYSTDPVGPDGPTLLLSGVVSEAVITGILGSNTGATLSASVTYTGGAIWVASGYDIDGDFAWSLVGIAPPLGVGGGGFLNPFATNATGLFDAVVPEPASALAALSIGGLLVARHRD